ncbi:MAG: hypothetical protein J07HQW2_00833 [Haloquadratum walsbyi J07HQW2]|uniref:Uncharacterized protein n=1 Tax=Haloquadratum walsbyi J07HQW2 TaxID=1238425 RepID=U1MVI8_9EURY|nr:MAG: hypothetical protein J07HQW2_00833 [Haloquadratum walsbyi J07HQW2]
MQRDPLIRDVSKSPKFETICLLSLYIDSKKFTYKYPIITASINRVSGKKSVLFINNLAQKKFTNSIMIYLRLYAIYRLIYSQYIELSSDR